MLRGGPDYLLYLYQTKGPVIFGDSPVLPGVAALGPDAAQVIYSNRNKDYSQQGWVPVIGPFFHRGLMLLDFEEHMFHRRIMQEAFIRSRLVGYVEQMDKVVSQVIANDWVANDSRFLLYPAMKELTLDIASMVFMGHEPGTDHELVTKVNKAFTITTRAGNAIIRTSVPPFTWWRGLQARELLENYFRERVKERRGKEGTDLLTVLCHTEDEDGNKFLRRGHRQPHDLPDDGRARHVHLDDDDDGLQPGRQPRVAGALPRRIRSARRRSAGHRVAGEAGVAGSGDERVDPAGDAGAVGDAPDGARHRAAGPLPACRARTSSRTRG